MTQQIPHSTTSANIPAVTRRQTLRRIVAGAALWGMGGANLAAAAGQDGQTSDGLTGESAPEETLLTYSDAKTQRYRCGLELDTRRAQCRNVVATFPLPRVWPEQEVRLIESNIDPLFSRWQQRDLDGLVSQFVSQAVSVPPGTIASALFTFELTRYRITGPTETDSLIAPKRPDRDLRQFLASSPYIDPGSARIRAAVREINETPASTDWARVETVYDWVRDKVSYVEGDIKSADDALKDGTGDCEELTSVFIAICRAMRIPARMVHVLMHCYPEFYLEDAEGVGHWIPCQAAGTRMFGSMEEYRPILQKGDRFKTPEQPLRRYVAEFFRAGAVRGGDPSPRFVQELLD